MLFLPAVVGVLATLYGVFEMTTNVPTAEICDANIAGSFVLCPGCKKRCTYDYLYTKCTFSKAGIVYMFDNPATVGFSIFMALWGECNACCVVCIRYLHKRLRLLRLSKKVTQQGIKFLSILGYITDTRKVGLHLV
ncbi:hypothetical protein HPB48_020363 [Haemaphysalis longicornis]|uniref:Uncharacterized protein n=1 Tax=Haemaphysalis longicornis TaxID=44386 RepID=A0A9J6H1I3_HAELO|nr:hypothetical protein HPB48_020363 [Haemaphysalis longicornis]